MTAPLQANPPAKAAEAAAAAASASAVRKRRRRAPAGGAADDCFTCSKRNVKCDRRRPYCSQCLEVGNECSGYKTQLTWGVGVASRGKLRGLSLPIAKSPPVNPGSSASHSGIKKSITSSPARARTESTSSASVLSAASWASHEALATASSGTTMSTPLIATASVSPRHYHDEADLVFKRSPSVPTSFGAYNISHMSPSHAAVTSGPLPVSVSVPVTMAHQNWAASASPSGALSPFSSSLPGDGLSFSHHHPQAQQMHQPPHSQKMGHPSAPEHHLSASLDSLSDVDYMSPISQSYPREEMVFVHSPTAMVYDSFTGHNSPVPQSPVAAMMIEQRPAPTSCPSLIYAPSEHSSSLSSSHPDNFDARLSAKLLQECESMGTPPDIDAYSTSAQSTNNQYWNSFADGETSPQMRSDPVSIAWPAMLDSQTQSHPLSSDLLSKMPFFMDYYENTMCPSLVFIDGPTNPFREHIMQLARGSQSLQHAICALAACNLRMKRKLSLGHHRRDVSDATDESTAPEDQSVAEEYQHRNLAVHLLNEQLNDPVKSRHDSVLATILLLCHYRMAESGIARFHTHFAGVRKILSLRRASPFPPSRECAWMETLFTYFDAITASINDREAQLNATFFGVPQDSQLLSQGSENLVGCDRDLFRTILKLGRLNLMSQNRPVQSTTATGAGSMIGNGSANTMARAISSRSQSPHGSPLGPMFNKLGGQRQLPHHHINPDLYGASRFENSNFGPALEDEEVLTAAASLASSSSYEDHRSSFWREWKEARLALQSWEFDPQRAMASLQSPSPLTSAQIRDLSSLSEAFRYAALLYTERLASPEAASGHNNFRNLVSQVVYYATSLTANSAAEKFLLWPLFVAGSECVNELQQNMIRSKCREIMSRSGYMNNLAALDVLERLWAGDFQDDAAGLNQNSSLQRRSPFNWTKCIGGQGVDVEWIMF